MWELRYDANGNVVVNLTNDIIIRSTPAMVQGTLFDELVNEAYAYIEILSAENKQAQELRNFMQMSEEEFEEWLKQST